MRLQLHQDLAARLPGISRRPLGPVALAAISVIAGVFLVSPGSAFAAGPGTPPCTSMLQYGSDVLPDPSINVQGASAQVVSVPDPAHEGETIDQVQITWDAGLAEKGAECVWISSKPAGETQFRTEADTIVAADATSYSVTPLGTPGQYCYRIIPLSQQAPAEPTDICVDVQHPQSVTSDSGPGFEASPTPPPATGAAPLPPDTGSGVGTSGSIPALLLGLGAVSVLFAAAAGAFGMRRGARH